MRMYFMFSGISRSVLKICSRNPFLLRIVLVERARYFRQNFRIKDPQVSQVLEEYPDCMKTTKYTLKIQLEKLFNIIIIFLHV